MHKTSHARSAGLKMNSLLNKSSQFDQGNMSTTIDGTQMSLQHQFDISTEVDPAEQKHNAMNLALGKPTQRFRREALGFKGRGTFASVQGHKDTLSGTEHTALPMITGMNNTGYTELKQGGHRQGSMPENMHFASDVSVEDSAAGSNPYMVKQPPEVNPTMTPVPARPDMAKLVLRPGDNELGSAEGNGQSEPL